MTREVQTDLFVMKLGHFYNMHIEKCIHDLEQQCCMRSAHLFPQSQEGFHTIPGIRSRSIGSIRDVDVDVNVDIDVDVDVNVVVVAVVVVDVDVVDVVVVVVVDE